MFTETDAQHLIGSDLHGAGDEKVGRIGQVYLDDQTGRPEWATVHTGFFGTSTWSAPWLGLIGASFTLTAGMAWLKFRQRRAAADDGDADPARQVGRMVEK